MIIKCVANESNKIPEYYQEFGYDNGADGHIASSLGKYYSVYAYRKNVKTDAAWYFVYTDNGYLWWMPVCAYEVHEDIHPEGWKVSEDGNYILSSYPALQDWKIEEGIIDGEKEAEDAFLNEVKNDPSFPSQQTIKSLNQDFDKIQRNEKYEKDLVIAKENGWELPDKPEDI